MSKDSGLYPRQLDKIVNTQTLTTQKLESLNDTVKEMSGNMLEMSGNMREVTGSMREMTGSMNKLTEAFMSWSSGMSGAMRRRSPSPTYRNNNNKCYACGEEGHYANQCQNRKSPTPSPEKSRQSRSVSFSSPTRSPSNDRSASRLN